MARLWCLDIDRWYLCTLIDINLHLSRHLLISIVSTDAHRSIVLPLVDDLYVVSSGEMSFKLQNAPKYKVNALPWEYRLQNARILDRISDQDWTGFHESKLNGGCHQRALKIAKSRFELFYWSLYESSLNGVTFQTCLKNLIPCIPSPKTSDYVRSTEVKDSVEGSMVKPSWSAMILGRILTDAPVSHIEWANSTPLTTHGIANFPGSLFFVNLIMCLIFSLT
ncbi:hypothetical protein IGI04_019376 [Brassica rapa subsp. trilocularis]|uniref:Uncharacterized protein n=1 Tax=Brassica rapa subsp. trilocularis TaxID=1813537 RepID=A0ABQ7MFN0_BRACM|nr:hypothetical protein IGI04_019376 [Brassica rapa subsp. trilocularis]